MPVIADGITVANGGADVGGGPLRHSILFGRKVRRFPTERAANDGVEKPQQLAPIGAVGVFAEVQEDPHRDKDGETSLLEDDGHKAEVIKGHRFLTQGSHRLGRVLILSKRLWQIAQMERLIPGHRPNETGYGHDIADVKEFEQTQHRRVPI